MLLCCFLKSGFWRAASHARFPCVFSGPCRVEQALSVARAIDKTSRTKKGQFGQRANTTCQPRSNPCCLAPVSTTWPLQGGVRMHHRVCVCLVWKVQQTISVTGIEETAGGLCPTIKHLPPCPLLVHVCFLLLVNTIDIPRAPELLSKFLDWHAIQRCALHRFMQGQFLDFFHFIFSMASR